MTLGWLSIFRLGLVQMCLGAIVVLTTSTLNRLMVVELALPAVLPGLLVALHPDQAGPAPPDAHDVVALAQRPQGDGADGGVETRHVPSPGQNADGSLAASHESVLLR